MGRRARLGLSEVGWLRLRASMLAIVCGAAAVFYLVELGQHYPVGTWLAGRVLTLFGWTALFSAGAVGAGSFVVDRLLPSTRLPRLEAVVLSMGAGVVVFGLCMYVGGALAWFGPWFAPLLQVVLALGGIKSLPRLLARAPAREPSSGTSWLGTPAIVVGSLGVALVYFGAFTPEAINYDATWSHLTVPQDYAREGRIVAFPGDYNKQVPHFASIVYTWGFMVPGLDAVGHWMLALHLEFAMFVWTLAGVAAAVHWVVGGHVRGIWAAFFLFPSILVYDNNLGGAADHVLAFFGPPIVLAARHFLTRLAWRPGVLLGMVLGGATLCKYQAMYFYVSMGALVAVRTLWLVVVTLRRSQRTPAGASSTPGGLAWRASLRQLRGPLVLLATLVVVASPHFIKNVVFHGNPVYPFMQGVFAGSHPVTPNGVLGFEHVFLDKRWVPVGTTWEKVVSTFEVFFTFSFLPHYSFSGPLPTFGSLFTLLLPCVVFFRKKPRLLFVVALASCGLLMWAATFRVDRNLQIILPLFVIATAAIIVEVWRSHVIARLGLVPLVVLQVIWGSDEPFFSGHARYRDTMDLIRSGYEKGAERRFDRYRSAYRAVERHLPKDAFVLVHGSHVSLGIDRNVILDWWGFQGLVYYDDVATAHDLVEYYQSLGVTHLVYTPQERIAPSRQEEVLWLDFTSRYGAKTKHFGQLRVLEVPQKAPEQVKPYRVLCVGLEGYADGVYRITDLNTNEYIPMEVRRYRKPRTPLASIEDMPNHLDGIDAVLVADRYTSNRNLKDALTTFPHATNIHGSFTVYLPKR